MSAQSLDQELEQRLLALEASVARPQAELVAAVDQAPLVRARRSP